MAKKTRNKRMDRVVESAERVFREKVKSISAPGGENRSSYRLHLPGRSIVATLRPTFQRTHLEAFTLRKLAPFCDDIPECLAVDDVIMFQSDVGSRRLNREIIARDPEDRLSLAAEAVASIFRIQVAGQKAGLRDILPHLGQNDEWIENFVHSADFLTELSSGRAADIDKDLLCARVATPATQFLKWDCRSGNAALGDDDRMRWFDFEYSGIRHGAEDLAWLLGDEVWPIDPDDMLAIITDAYDPALGHSLDAYLDYLALYTTFHCIQRLQLVTRESEKRGWQSMRRIRKYDDAGVHPHFAAHLCRVGAFFAHRNTLTAPIARDFEEAEQVFVTLLRDGMKQKMIESAC